MQIGAEALTEVHDAADWYDQRRLGLGGRFLEAFFTAVEAIEQSPDSAPRLETLAPTRTSRDIRRRMLPGFPYLVAYEMFRGEPFVLAVYHAHRRPNFWLERLPEH